MIKAARDAERRAHANIALVNLAVIAAAGPILAEMEDGWAAEVGRDDESDDLWQPLADPDGGDAWLAESAAFDAVFDRSDRVLSGVVRARQQEREPLVYDLDWDKEVRLSEWRAVVESTKHLSPVLAVALDTGQTVEPRNIGRGLAHCWASPAYSTREHLARLNIGMKLVPLERCRALGLIARRLLERKALGRRSTSELSDLINVVLEMPITSASMIADVIGVTPRAAQDLVVELGLREATSRGRYRAWGIL